MGKLTELVPPHGSQQKMRTETPYRNGHRGIFNLAKKNLLAPRLGRGRAESQKIWGGRGNARERGAGSGFHVGKVLRAVHILHSLP